MQTYDAQFDGVQYKNNPCAALHCLSSVQDRGLGGLVSDKTLPVDVPPRARQQELHYTLLRHPELLLTLIGNTGPFDRMCSMDHAASSQEAFNGRREVV